MTFNLNETYFPEKFAIWRYLTSKSSKFGQSMYSCSKLKLSYIKIVNFSFCLKTAIKTILKLKHQKIEINLW